MFTSTCGLSLLLDDSRHFFSLSLGTDVSTQSLLQESKTSLILRDTEQFKCSTFVWGETHDFTNSLFDEFILLGFHSALTRVSWCDSVLGHFFSFTLYRITM